MSPHVVQIQEVLLQELWFEDQLELERCLDSSPECFCKCSEKMCRTEMDQYNLWIGKLFPSLKSQ